MSRDREIRGGALSLPRLVNYKFSRILGRLFKGEEGRGADLRADRVKVRRRRKFVIDRLQRSAIKNAALTGSNGWARDNA